MSSALLLVVGGLTAVGLYFLTGRSLSRVVLGYSLLGHAAVVALVVAGGSAGEAPIVGQAEPQDMSNPLPQALTLTAIVISFGLTLFLLALAKRQRVLSGDDLVEDDLEDRRIADPDAPPAPDDAGGADHAESEHPADAAAAGAVASGTEGT
ncbi:MAG: NADH-quinone oxidoreductase subunit K [Acidimicrobiaceae bacterium]|nr:NADH-quinone oxidoreductase subunit K [Acidimicrobiaceae bacterium]MCY4280924.1 NADH-quinone oxidoreductase subunit K [Acidimicrobiaceae bacterium]MCY4294786.1 NADH-quinone oxidoreductase subunit K [Acidimicrobiaceae bacterium]